MSPFDMFNLLQLPLSAYSPGQPVILPGRTSSIEGKFETASGAPVYTYEAWLRGEAPYVTGATNQKNPTGQLVYRTIGDRQVPVRITDYGPGTKGLDIATSNKDWAADFPYQGQKDTLKPRLADDRTDLLRDIDNTIYGGGHAPAPTPTPTPAGAPPAPRYAYTDDGRPVPINPGVLADFAVRNYAPGATEAATAAAPAAAAAPPAANAAPNIGGMIGGALSAFGRSMSQNNNATQQALAMLQRRPSAMSALLAQLANNPTMYLQPTQLG